MDVDLVILADLMTLGATRTRQQIFRHNAPKKETANPELRNPSSWAPNHSVMNRGDHLHEYLGPMRTTDRTEPNTTDKRHIAVHDLPIEGCAVFVTTPTSAKPRPHAPVSKTEKMEENRPTTNQHLAPSLFKEWPAAWVLKKTDSGNKSTSPRPEKRSPGNKYNY